MLYLFVSQLTEQEKVGSVAGMVKGPRKAGVQSGNSPELMVSVTYKVKLILLIYKITKYHTP